jgi:hypothetical protein
MPTFRLPQSTIKEAGMPEKKKDKKDKNQVKKYKKLSNFQL